MKHLIIRIASRATRSRYAQNHLRNLSLCVNYLRGLGSGSGLAASGEAAAFHLLAPNCTIFDVGANRGDYARAALAAIPTANVHCFEPSKKTFELLERNLQGDRVQLNNFGLSDRATQGTLFSPSDGSGWASLSKRRLDHFGIEMKQEETINLYTLDSYCEQRNIERIDLLKVDVEGHEMGVFKGGMNMLSSRRIGLIAFEFGGCNIDSRTFFQDFYYLFQELGMKSLSRFGPSDRFYPVSKYTEDLEYFRTTNYLVSF